MDRLRMNQSSFTAGNISTFDMENRRAQYGGFCIPVYIPYVLTGEWRLGRGICKLWLVIDYLLCTASVFNIVLISFDRFQSVTRAMSDRCQKGVTREALLKMACVWLAAFLLYGPAIISWEYIAGGSVVPDGACYAEFYYNWYFLMTASTVEFFTPFISVTYFNISIYINIRKRNLMRVGKPNGKPNGEGQRESGVELQGMVQGEKQRVFFISPTAPGRRAAGARSSSLPCANALAGPGGRKTRLLDLPPLQLEDLVRRQADRRCRTAEQGPGRSNMADANMGTCFRLSRDKKVAKCLAVIVCVFGLCWAPYTLLMIIRAACHGQCVQQYWYEMSFWLLWINSSINPVLYPLCHASFKRAFIKLLCPSKIKVQPLHMEHKC
ncbi:histamine H3 receptor-like isoform X3 [Conger conger]|uniref:histamine H3 receptor-like isoform X3 n=1 Tax=Conger conger TaxID=82655 RepID=UPI002A59D12C|nr:histamine H3 receptor-like isoform X3 [Conger conger]